LSPFHGRLARGSEFFDVGLKLPIVFLDFGYYVIELAADVFVKKLG
jgi:hypothetical protein